MAVQFLGISIVVGKEAIGHIQRRQGPEEAGLLLGIAFSSVVVLSVLCGLKLDLSVRTENLWSEISICLHMRCWTKFHYHHYHS